MHSKIQLIAYPDRIGNGLADLADFVEQRLEGIIDGLHILPPFPSNSDGGFSPLSHKAIDPRFGSWADIERIGAKRALCLDLTVNHISDESEEFKDFLAHGRQSRWASLFVDVDAMGPISREDLGLIHIRKEKEPFRELRFADGSPGRVWCTFTERQIDLDYRSPVTYEYMTDTMAFMAARGVQMLRLDAFGYVTKQIGTSCFLVEPRVWEVLGWFREQAARLGLELLPEAHDHPSYQYAIARQGMWAYGFALPPLVLSTLLFRSSRHLKDWLRMCPRQQVTVLDTHDGICIPDVEGVLPEPLIERLIEEVSTRSADPILRRCAATVHSVGAIYQLTCTFYDALQRDDDAYALARAIQLFAPGLPQVYYVGLLAGVNDEALGERSGDPRDVNRHYYTRQEADEALRQSVVQRQLRLMALRCNHPAFEGEFALHSSEDSQLSMGWHNGRHHIRLDIDLVQRCGRVQGSEATGDGHFSLEV